jgi:hypothetical protein
MSLIDNEKPEIKKNLENDTYKFFHPTALTQSQKLVSLGLAFFTFLIVIIWSRQLSQNLSDPYGVKNNKSFESEEQLCLSGLCDTSEDEISSDKDTDGDGLWDIDELNIYYTSPYLEDTDSDGIIDSKEIEQGSDPTCAQGQNCYAEEAELAETNYTEADINGLESYNSFLDEINSDVYESLDTDENPASSEAETSEVQSLLSGELSADELRELLLSSGISYDIISNFSDAEILKAYNDLLLN